MTAKVPTAGTASVLVASNRGPVSFATAADGSLVLRRGGGGLVSGLRPVARSGATVWVCAAMSDADRHAAAAAPDGHLHRAGHDTGGATVQMLTIEPATFHLAYNTIANSVLWFHHHLFDTPNQPWFDRPFRREWQAYVTYNEVFANALAAAAAPRAAVVIQDYHLALVPGQLRQLRPDLRIGHFSHTPWAAPSYYRVLPDDVGRELLLGMLAADCVSFLSPRWADAFLLCCEALPRADGVRVDRATATVTAAGHRSRVSVHPLGIDGEALRARGHQADVEARLAGLRDLVGDRKLIVRVDRTELAKNIVRGLAAYRELLRIHPRWHGKVVHLAFAYPSRHDLPEYRDYMAAVRQLLDPADPRGQRRLSPVVGRLPTGGRAGGQPAAGRDEPGGQGGAGALRPRLRDRALSRRGRGRCPGRGRARRQSVRRQRHRRGNERRAGHGRRRAVGANAPASGGRHRGAATAVVRRPDRRAELERGRHRLVTGSVAADSGRQRAHERHHAGWTSHHEVRPLGHFGHLVRTTAHRHSGNAVGPQTLDRGVRRQVPEIVPGEQHRPGPLLGDEPPQRAALVDARRPQLEHEPAGSELQAGPFRQLGDRRPQCGQRPMRVGGTAGVHDQRGLLVLHRGTGGGGAGGGEQRRKLLPRLLHARRHLRRHHLIRRGVPALEAVMAQHDQPAQMRYVAQARKLQHGGHRSAGDDDHGPDAARHRGQRGHRALSRAGVLGPRNNRRQRAVVIDRDDGTGGLGKQSGQAGAPRRCGRLGQLHVG